jgi:hypothetical protein
MQAFLLENHVEMEDAPLLGFMTLLEDTSLNLLAFGLIFGVFQPSYLLIVVKDQHIQHSFKP